MDYKIYDLMESFTLLEASYLWCELDIPTNPETKLSMHEEVARMNRVFKNNVQPFILEVVEILDDKEINDMDDVVFEMCRKRGLLYTYIVHKFFPNLFYGDWSTETNHPDGWKGESLNFISNQPVPREDLIDFARRKNQMPNFLLSQEEREALEKSPQPDLTSSIEDKEELERLKAEIIKLKNEHFPYINRGNKNFAPELEAAINAWEHFSKESKYWTKELVQKWLKKEFNLSDNAAERISIIINPQSRKKGGAPKTSAV